MSVFISWSGRESQAIAKELRDFLAGVLQNSHPWMSAVDIAAGDTWGFEIGAELERASFGVVCVTSENVEHSWLAYEAGAIAHKVAQRGRVCPMVRGMSLGSIPQPLGRFQAKELDRPGVRDLVNAINDSLDQQVPTAALDKTFKAMWPSLKKALDKIPPSKARIGKRPTESELMLRELLSLVRSLATEREIPWGNLHVSTTGLVRNNPRFILTSPLSKQLSSICDSQAVQNLGLALAQLARTSLGPQLTELQPPVPPEDGRDENEK